MYSVIAMFAVANTALLNFVMGSRLVYGMAHQGLLPKALAKIHPKRQTPYIAALILFAISLGLAISGDISSLAKSTSVLLLSCFMLVNIALVILKHRKNEPRGKFEVPTVVPVLGAMVCFCLLLYAQGPELKTAGFILAAIAVLYFVIRPNDEAVKSYEEL